MAEVGHLFNKNYPDMTDRLLKGWNFQRGMYVLLGAYLVYQSFVSHEYLGVLFGGYFASMGLFAFGCAGTN